MSKNSLREARHHISQPQAHVGVRVGVLFIRNLNDALRFDDLASATSEFRWLDPEVYLERCGGVRLVPGSSTRLQTYAADNRLHLFGLVVVNEDGKRTDLLIEKAINPEYREPARLLFRKHAEFWCSLRPRQS